ncbi:MAG: recombinase family protein [Pirellulales bacterium]
MKQFVALARVSSREQEREGFSLEVQEEALRRYALQSGGEIVRLYRIAETASKTDERRTFRELIAFAKKNAGLLDGLLFYKVDRAARNLFDYVELERLESEYQVPFISVSQPTDNNPAGRMMRRTLANMASFYTEQQSLDVKEGLARRVKEGWFAGKAPYGYRNVRKQGRSVVEIDPVTGPKVRKVFELYAYGGLTLDALVAKLGEEGVAYRDNLPKFPRGSVHGILRDRAYIGEVEFRGHWYPGRHVPLVDRGTWDRVQAFLGGHVYQSHELTYAGERIVCGHCGRPITGEKKTKRLKSGDRHYVYYHCTGYTAAGHPRTRVTEHELDRQVLAVFDRMRIQDDTVREWFRTVLRSQTMDAQQDSKAQRAEVQRQVSLLIGQQDKLLDLRIREEIDAELFAKKHADLRERVAKLKLQLEVLDRSHDEMSDLAVKAFELSQTLREQWLTADYATKRRILEIICLNCRLVDATLVLEMRRPFDVLAEGPLVSLSRGDRI